MSRGAPVFSVGSSTETLVERLHELRYVVLEHPVASRALFGALVAEGRRAQRTAEGRAVRERLLRSPLVRELRLVLDVATVEMLHDDGQSILPGNLLDALMQAAGTDGLESLLEALQRDPAAS